jgi:hypothetical protein
MDAHASRAAVHRVRDRRPGHHPGRDALSLGLLGDSTAQGGGVVTSNSFQLREGP